MVIKFGITIMVINRGYFFTQQSEFDLMFEYVDEVDGVLPAAVAANTLGAYGCRNSKRSYGYSQGPSARR